MSILARYSGRCPECDEIWQPGDLLCGADFALPYEQRRRPTVWRHVTCPDDEPERPVTVCPTCHLPPATCHLTKPCDCEEDR